MPKKIKKPHQNKGVIVDHFEKSKKNATVRDLSTSQNFLISFRHFDREQSESFLDWQAEGILASAIDTLSWYCQTPFESLFDGKRFVKYGDFPPNSKYFHPDHVPPDANWARIHINGLHIIAGHVFENVFYIVFLDSKHEFWIMSDR